tara:strand:+ start:615 stop:1127 length:513 start_codon:yes stop_codon:yes gene_type:complete
MLTACIGPGEIASFQKQSAGHFPDLVGINLHGETVPVPQSFEGEYNLVVVAFKREQQEQVNEWIALADELMKEYETLSFYELPVIYELPAPMRSWINNGMRSGIPGPQARSRTITIYTDREKFFAEMAMSEDYIYPLMLDGKGKILWRGQGVPDDRQRTDILSLLNSDGA